MYQEYAACQSPCSQYVAKHFKKEGKKKQNIQNIIKIIVKLRFDILFNYYLISAYFEFSSTKGNAKNS